MSAHRGNPSRKNWTTTDFEDKREQRMRFPELKLKIKLVPKKTTAPTDSHLVTHGNTKGALGSLTLEIERDPVLSTRYGRS
jgi:hypothetical protein